MRIVWDRQFLDTPRIVIFDFDRVKFGRDDGSIFLTEQTTLDRFLAELGAWQSCTIITDWLKGEGKSTYEKFAENLLTPKGLAWRDLERSLAAKTLEAMEAEQKMWDAVWPLHD